MSDRPGKTSKVKPSMIRDVFIHNFKEELIRISTLLPEFPYVGMDTEFPGIVYTKENNQGRSYSNYQLTKLNVDSLKLIQVGITLSDKNGLYPNEICTWQFNLKFDINSDKHLPSSIQLLISSGIDFDSLANRGIPHLLFGEYLIVSGLVLNTDVFWVTFHGIYDFAYLLKILTNTKLPDLEKEFYDSLDLYFCNYFDVRHLVQFSDYSRGSLQKLALECSIQRVGTQHQAGSDSIVTVMTFFKLVTEVFATNPVSNYKNVLFHYIEKDDVEFDTNKVPFYGSQSFNPHFNNFRNNMHMYLYPYYSSIQGMNNLSTFGSFNQIKGYSPGHLIYDDKRRMNNEED